MKKSNGYFLKGTVKRMCGALAIAAVLAVTPVIFDGCQNQTGTEQNGQKEYDANGWNIKDLTDPVNQNGTMYDKEGYDRAGYNEAGWNRQEKHKDTGTIYDSHGYDIKGYDKYGWNREGQNKNETMYDDNGFNIDGTQHKDTGNPYDLDGYDRDGYDVDGWHRNPNDKMNKNGTYYKDGVDRDGYDMAGWNTQDLNDPINKFTGEIYDENGYDRDGHQQPDPSIEIPTYDAAEMDVVLGTVYGGTGQYNIRQQWPTSDTLIRNTLGELLIVNWFPQLATQAEKLNEGYSAAASKYPAYDSQFSGIAAGEAQTMSSIMLYGGNVDNIINAIFGADTANKTQFNSYLAAYQQGHYIDKKQRVDNSYGGNPQTKAEMTAVLEPLLNGLGLTTISKDGNGAITDESLITMLSELKALMLPQLNNATGVGATPIITGPDQAKIQALNAHLLQQIGDDRGELRALIDDINNIGFTNINIGYAISDGMYAMEPQKAGQLNNYFNFNLEFLKPKENQVDVRMV